MKPVEFVIQETDDTLVTHSGLALVGALLGRTEIARRANALALESKPRPETAHADVLLSMIGLLSLGSLPAALLTILTFKLLGLDEKTLTGLVTGVLSVALLLTAAALLFKDRIQKLAKREDGTVYELHHRHLPAATIATGAVVGVLVTISSIGAGVLGTVALLFLYPRLTTVKVVGTDIAHAVPLTAVAGLGHMTMGTVDFVLLGSLLLGSLPGIYIGSHLSAKVPEKVLRPILAVMLLLIGTRLVLN